MDYLIFLTTYTLQNTISLNPAVHRYRPIIPCPWSARKRKCLLKFSPRGKWLVCEQFEQYKKELDTALYCNFMFSVCFDYRK